MSTEKPQPKSRAAGDLSPRNPVDHLRLLGWFFFAPERLEAYRQHIGRQNVQKVGAWLTGDLLWLPVLILMLAVGLGSVPPGAHRVPIWLIAAGMALGWALTGLLAERERDTTGGWRGIFGEVFSITFITVFGLAFGAAFGMALIVGFDLAHIVVFGGMFSSASIILLVAAFALAFGIAFIVADEVAFAGIFIVVPVIAFMAAFVGVFGLGFMGPFFATFIVVFGLAFMAAFTVGMLSAATVVKKLEANMTRGLGMVFRMVALAALTLAYGLLVWICLLGGWRALG